MSALAGFVIGGLFGAAAIVVITAGGGEDGPRAKFVDEDTVEAAGALFVRQRTGRPVVVSSEETDCATGYCRCSVCGKPVDFWDAFCRHCGALIAEVDE